MSVAKASRTRRKKPSRKGTDTGIDKALVKAMGHPDRLWALSFLNKRVASPNEMAQELNVDVNYIAYHVRVLEKSGCIELVETKPRRGATEHFYRAKKRAHFRKREWLRIPQSLREEMLLTSLEEMGKDVTYSAEQGRFEGRADRHWSHTPGAVDVEGWKEAQVLLDETLERWTEIQGKAANRMAKSGETAIRMAVTLMGFELGQVAE